MNGWREGSGKLGLGWAGVGWGGLFVCPVGRL